MIKNKGIWSIVGFLLAAIGFLAIALSMVGIRFAFLTWLDAPGPLFGFIAKIAMIIIGILILYLAQSDFSGEENPDY
jgi:membrane protein insertase Oxa1/YidC/SpoIIIJ